MTLVHDRRGQLPSIEHNSIDDSLYGYISHLTFAMDILVLLLSFEKWTDRFPKTCEYVRYRSGHQYTESGELTFYPRENDQCYIRFMLPKDAIYLSPWHSYKLIYIQADSSTEFMITREKKDKNWYNKTLITWYPEARNCPSIQKELRGECYVCDFKVLMVAVWTRKESVLHMLPESVIRDLCVLL